MAKMSKTMKIRAIKALTLLTAYLLSTAGTALTALTCQCEHLHRHTDEAIHAVACCCGHQHASHTTDCDRHEDMAVQSDERCCNHNHSTDTELYTADSNESAGIRTAAPQSDAAAGSADISATPLRAVANTFAERRCPPAQKCRAVLRPLRAPPVCA